jgi:C_GCAxxG_C_C family probable redox protein
MQMIPSLQAEKFFAQGYLCSQSILMAYAPLFNLERETAARLAAPFGGGVARRGETCGAVAGACMVLGLKFGHNSAEDIESKEQAYQAVNEFISRFESRHGSIVCSHLLEVDISSPDGLQQARDEDLFTTRCPGYVDHAAHLLDEILSA